jgi:hypothetical protein
MARIQESAADAASATTVSSRCLESLPAFTAGFFFGASAQADLQRTAAVRHVVGIRLVGVAGIAAGAVCGGAAGEDRNKDQQKGQFFHDWFRESYRCHAMEYTEENAGAAAACIVTCFAGNRQTLFQAVDCLRIKALRPWIALSRSAFYAVMKRVESLTEADEGKLSFPSGWLQRRQSSTLCQWFLMCLMRQRVRLCQVWWHPCCRCRMSPSRGRPPVAWPALYLRAAFGRPGHCN